MDVDEEVRSLPLANLMKKMAKHHLHRILKDLARESNKFKSNRKRNEEEKS